MVPVRHRGRQPDPLYSIGYMKGDTSYGRFFFYMNLFLFSMIVLVLADNYLFSFLGWEGRRLLLLRAGRLLVRAGQRGGGGQEGLRHQPRSATSAS